MAADLEVLLSLPPAMAEALRACEPRLAARCFAASDPPGRPLGSGGGTAHLLARAWEASGRALPFSAWLDGRLRAVVHGGGASRRLPAYAATGKPFLPIPAFRWSRGQRIDQTLLDAQLPFLEEVAGAAPAGARVLVSSGDVLLLGGESLAALPETDIAMLGLWTTPEQAQPFGVLFVPADDPRQLLTFLQKPSSGQILRQAGSNHFLLDVGVWLLSAKAVRCLMRLSGWDEDRQAFAGGLAAPYDMYGRWALHLGRQPVVPDPEVSALSVAVVPLNGAKFFHVGTSADLIQSVHAIQNLVVDQTVLGAAGAPRHPRVFVQNAQIDRPLDHERNHTCWIENAHLPASWRLAHDHVLTGIPDNDWPLSIEPGACLDVTPVGAKGCALRAYGIGDLFRGPLGDPATRWLGRPATEWFARRGLPIEACCGADTDIQDAPLFPVLDEGAIEAEFVAWMLAGTPAGNARLAELWTKAPRLSAAGIAREANLRRLYELRGLRMAASLLAMARNHRRSVFHRLDLESAAEHLADAEPPAPEDLDDPVIAAHDRMFRSALARLRGGPEADAEERAAFGALRDAIVASARRQPAEPARRVLEDQIVWGRSPVRVDIAGGWTDTPPYCLEHGGRVLNLAVDLNGQPPIQVFARMAGEPRIVVRSIDLGIEDVIADAAQLAAFGDAGSGFAIARAALALAGFHPDFCAGRHASLAAQLQGLGGGIELSMLAAVPKGSGLGTSSILAATLLATLSDMLGLGWNLSRIAARTLALEQLLGCGGGWQDQVGGLYAGAKLVETAPGLEQRPDVRWLPEGFFEEAGMRGRLLLYYTGITRIAHSILGDIVRGLFLNRGDHLRILGRIGRNAAAASDAVLRQDREGFARSIARSWTLNQALDPGTSVPEVQRILERCAPWLSAAKLTGAGGGGYLLMMARDADAARRIRDEISASPPNAKARFVDMSLSKTGLQVTRS
jgi:galactokinase/mevalonate kinase-like predicted kinase